MRQRRSPFGLLLFAIALGAGRLEANPVLVKDVGGATSPSTSVPGPFVEMAGNLYFRACTPAHGCELWRSDGTAAGTRLVVDLSPSGPGSDGNADPSGLTVVGGKLYFTAADAHGRELWMSDGTAAGTSLVKDIAPGGDDSWAGGVFELNGGAWFWTSAGLWKTDGTPGGTTLQVPAILPQNPVRIGSRLFFTQAEPASGRELWVTDGTPAGTTLLGDIWPGSASSFPSGLFDFAGTLLFVADNGATGPELWKSDGTPAGTILLKDIRTGTTGSNPRTFVNAGGVVFFGATSSSTSTYLWKTDGTGPGTVRVSSTVTLPNSPPIGAWGSDVYFAGTNGSSGFELWKSNGFSAGTVLVADIWAGSSSALPGGFHPYGSELLFVARTYDGPFGVDAELWATDGTGAGTRRVADIRPGLQGSLIDHFHTFGGHVYFEADDGTRGAELWRTDGSEVGTVLVCDISPSHPANLALASARPDRMLFVVDDGTTGQELWTTDGTGAGTEQLVDVCPGSCGSWIGMGAPLGDLDLFLLNDGASGVEFWKTDGTAAGTVPVADAVPGSGGLYPFSSTWGFVERAGALYGSLSDGSNGYELWRCDGTAAGTGLVVDIDPAPGASGTGRVVAFGGALFFPGQVGSSGEDLWTSDGTAAGTVLLTELYPGNPSARIQMLGNGAGRTWLAAGGDGVASRLWASDGTAAGTVLVWDGCPTCTLGEVHEVAGRVVFTADEPSSGIEPWVSDGTPAGTQRLADVFPGLPGSSPRSFVAFGGALYFAALDSTHGVELWRTDGTPAGTSLFLDLRPGAASSLPQDFVVEGSEMTFVASGLESGQELWRSDGSAAGTFRLTDLDGGAEAGGGSGARRVGSRLLFRGREAASGQEIWAYSLSAGGTAEDDSDPGLAPLRLRKLGGGSIEASWGESCRPEGDDYALYQGALDQPTIHAPLACSTVGARSWTFVAAQDDLHLLVVPRNALREGVYGHDSSGGEIPPGTPACAGQVVDACP